MNVKWSDKEIEILKKEYVTGGCKVAMKFLSRSESSIHFMAYRLGIKVNKSVLSGYAKAYHAEHDQCGKNNPNWKGGITKSNYHYKKIQVKRYPEKIRARDLVRLAIKRGAIKRQPCEICGNPKTQAHHENYSKPYEVHWLCKKHHDEVHYKARIL